MPTPLIASGWAIHRRTVHRLCATRLLSTYDSLQGADILCFAGAEEGIYAACQVLLGPDDHAIVVTPNYQAAETVPLSICAVTGVPLEPRANWDLDVDRVAAAIRSNTRLLSINFPHNPTGRILSRDTLNSLIELCRRHGLWLFSDEVYRLLGPDPARHLPQIADLYERGLSLNVMSKAYGLPGLRIGWIGCRDRELLMRMERMKHYLSICNSGPSEALAGIALKNRQPILERNNALVRTNLELLDEFFAEFRHLFEWRRPDGGCIGYPRYLGAGSVDDFCTRLVRAVRCASAAGWHLLIQAWGRRRAIISASGLAARAWPTASPPFAST